MILHRICINYLLPLFVVNVIVWSIVNTRYGRSLWFNLRSGNKTLSKESVLIVIWTNFYNNHVRVTFTQRWRPFLKHCEQLNCRFTEDRSLVGKADAVLFSLLETKVSDLPPIRHPWQYYILFTQEPPYLTYRTRPGQRGNPSRETWKRLDGFFNLTWTYRQDSDIVDRHYGTAARLKTDPLPYDRIPTTTTQQLSKVVSGKDKLIAWFVSNCRTASGRLALVKELMKYVPVHIYGKCARRFCASSRAYGGNCVPLFCHYKNTNANASNFGSCDGKLAKEYKFYLAFENEVCKDYVTEKFFRIASYVVPIVMQHDHVARLAPNSSIYPSYIAVDNFISVKKLAEYLLYLDRNPEAYRRYYDWHETMYMQQYREDQGIYELCSRLKTGGFPEKKVYEHLYDWWNAAARCQGEVGVSLVNRGNGPIKGDLD